MTLNVDLGLSPAVFERARRIKLLLMDVDGVLTDGRLFYLPGADGKPVEFKGFNSQDGLGFHFLNHVGIKTGVISGRESPATVERARILKMTYVFQGHLEKVSVFKEILKDAQLSAQEVAFIGDDFTDAPLIKMAGLGCCVGDARPELKQVADIVAQAKGGHGAVREIIEIILRVQQKWEEVLAQYDLLEQQSVGA